MGKVEAYEHRGSRYRSLKTDTEAQVQDVLRLFHQEHDMWLKKILAMKLHDQDVWQPGELDRVLISEALKCRIDS